MNRKRTSVFIGVCLAVALSGCGGKADRQPEPAAVSEARITVTPEQPERRLIVGLAEWSITPGSKTIPAGAITIVAANLGQTLHDLVIVQSDAGPTELEVVADRSDESKLKIIGRFQEFKSGEKEKQFALQAGRYLLICNLPTHYELGMVAQITVE